jgi:hypothetical protein
MEWAPREGNDLGATLAWSHLDTQLRKDVKLIEEECAWG